MPIYDWKAWLERWNRDLLEYIDPEEIREYEQEGEGITAEIIASGWLGFPGASDDEIEAFEARLGMRLPPSYRQFLQASNGFCQPGRLVHRLFRMSEVEWFRVNHQDTIDILLDSHPPWRAEPRIFAPDDYELYLPDALVVSAREIGGSAMYLLNPRVVNENAEWEAFYYANWVPGVDRYPSFWDLMQREYTHFLDYHHARDYHEDDEDDDDYASDDDGDVNL